eukprot:gb/GECG01002132.1/.p1 GENE.gb/GECG01002132.1/~~gb/GECG01002132.1/.p1  ORF type:complete len:684 (+),score=66.69 gb/GECG01002132.1/:1-2052(+)
MRVLGKEIPFISVVFLAAILCQPGKTAAQAVSTPAPTPCPGTDSSGCTCWQWSGTEDVCRRGYYCPEGGDGYPCPQGYYCPENSVEPTLCCEGYYCPSPSEIKVCTKGHFCRKGQIEPFKCGWTERCPEGTSEPQEVGMFALLVVSCLLLIVAAVVKDKYYQRKTAARQARQKRIVKQWDPDASSPLSEKTEHVNPIRDSDAMGQDIEMPQRRPSRNFSFDIVEAKPNDKKQTNPINEKKPKKPVRGYRIQFEDLGVQLPNGKTILSGVSGSLEPGHTTAIMGPSGAGKSTFINVLSNKVERTEGSIEVDDEPKEDGLAQYRTVFGFVPQEDVMLRHFSPYYNITFSAKYRLPKGITTAERRDKVTETLELLGILHVQNQTIGDERQRGISGGQRKRVNIGIELVNECAILFLDEPTSGLDSSSAMDICNTLRKTAEDRGITIAAILHQPRYEIFETFTDLLLLGEGGRTIYSGPRGDVMSYLASVGFHPPKFTNPADYLADISSGRVYREGSEHFDPSSNSFFPAHLLPDLWLLHKQGQLNETEIRKLEKDYVDSKRSPASNEGGKDTGTGNCYSSLVSWTQGKSDMIRAELKSQKRNFQDSFGHNKIRSTPGIMTMFIICFTRACKGVLHSVGRFFCRERPALLRGILSRGHCNGECRNLRWTSFGEYAGQFVSVCSEVGL